MIAIVDYGLGNILAFSNMFKRLNIEARVATCADELAGDFRHRPASDDELDQ